MQCFCHFFFRSLLEQLIAQAYRLSLTRDSKHNRNPAGGRKLQRFCQTILRRYRGMLGGSSGIFNPTTSIVPVTGHRPNGTPVADEFVQFAAQILQTRGQDEYSIEGFGYSSKRNKVEQVNNFS